MLRGTDIVVLLKLAGSPGEWTTRSLESDIGISRASVHRSLQALSAAGLYDLEGHRVNVSQAEECLIHAVKYFFPPVQNGEARGVPTAWAAAPLVSRLAPQTDPPPVWPHALGEVRGIALEPLHKSAPDIAQRDPDLGEMLALVDALRLDDARVRGLASELLIERLGSPSPVS